MFVYDDNNKFIVDVKNRRCLNFPCYSILHINKYIIPTCLYKLRYGCLLNKQYKTCLIYIVVWIKYLWRYIVKCY